jgi:hypothetical protein
MMINLVMIPSEPLSNQDGCRKPSGGKGLWRMDDAGNHRLDPPVPPQAEAEYQSYPPLDFFTPLAPNVAFPAFPASAHHKPERVDFASALFLALLRARCRCKPLT